MNTYFDPRNKTNNDQNEEVMLAEALYIYEKDLEGEDNLEDED